MAILAVMALLAFYFSVVLFMYGVRRHRERKRNKIGEK